MTTDGAARRWAARPLQARLIRVCVFMVPVAGSVVSVHVFSRLVEMPTSSFLLFILWWVAMSVAATGVLVVLDRAARRLLPLAALLNLSLAFPDAAPSRFRTAMRSNTVETLTERVEHARALNDGSTPVEEAERLLALVAELNVHDRITRGHSDRVRAYAQLIGKELHLTPNELDALNWAALLHDVGKLKVPAEILNKPGRPTDEAWVVLRRHTVYGEELIAPLRAWLGEWSHAVGQHHERWNGSGYPYRLAGDGISLAARIVAVADVFDVITSARSYKAPLSSAVARDEIARSTGTHFDPRVVRAFLGVSLGRLRLVMGPLSWLAHAPILGRLPLTPAIGTMAMSMATVAGALATGLVTAPPPPGAARIVPVATQAPAEANPIERATPEDASLVVGVGQPGGGASVSSLRVVAQPSVGHVRVTPDHRLLYSPPPDFNGVVSVRYRACWAGQGCRLGVLLIRVLPVNDPPTARNDLAVTESGATVTIDVLANDSDPEGDPLSIRSVTDVDVGDARIVGRRVRWSAPKGFVGTVSFGYTVGDGQGGRAGALATIRVTDVPPPSPPEESQPGESATPVAAPAGTPTVVPAPAPAAAPASPPTSPLARPPLARADRLSVPAGGTVLVDVLANDADPDGDTLSIVSVGTPARGAARRVGDRVQFTAPSDYVGLVTFRYTIADPQGARDSATVSVTVLLVNTPPSFTPGPDQSVAEDAGPQSVPGWARDIDPGATSEVGQAVSFAVVADNSSLFAEQPRIGPSGDLSYTPAPNAHGSATVTVRAQDNGGTANGGRDGSAPVPFTITVAPVNDPPLAKSDDVSVAEDDAAGVTFNVLGNDVDADVGDTLVVSSHNGSAVASGTLTDNGGGSFTYVPDSDVVGSATFSYTASDGNGGTATAVVTLSVTSRPDAPDAAGDAYTTLVATALAPGAPGVLGNDADADGDTLTVQTTPVVAPANGTLVLGSDGSFTYTPADGFSGTDSFTYRIDDGTGLTDDAVATITVSSSITLSSLYFADTGPLSTIWGMTPAPPAPASPVPDYDADGSPGLTIEQSDGKESNTDPTKFKAWAYTPSAPLVLNGPVTLQLWSTIADFGINKKGHPFVYLYDCAAGGAPCVKIAENDVHVNDWNGTTSTWMSRTITVGSVVHTIVPGRSLKVVLLFGHDDLWLAMTAAHPSGLTLSLG